MLHAVMPCTIQKWLNHGNVAIFLSFEVRNINLNDEKGNVIERSDKNWLWDLVIQCATSHHLK
jgi:L-2-hydroxyglutarate oxidase LhgO